MPERNNMSVYEQMTEQELAAVLRADFEGAESDTETLLYVMELYAGCQTVKPTKTPSEAYTSFLRDYLRSNVYKDRSVPRPVFSLKGNWCGHYWRK